MTTVIRVENLGKKYIIGHEGRERYETLRDTLARSARNLMRRILRSGAGETEKSPSQEELWALKDVSFEVKEGERIGIIGRNGSGKSTLLKLLSRITEPTEGRIRLKGRVASLLEVGTGFHPELTGRENIFLNGAVLGMSKAEIKRKFDQIVDFSGVEKFLDTPVKRYSSGMQVRLAFSVAAHLEPEILLVDEVLAVGDHEFQKKCLGKMDEVAKGGRTVLFVSHNMGAVRQLCQKALQLHDGNLVRIGEDVENVIREYLRNSESGMSGEWRNNGKEFANEWFDMIAMRLLDGEGHPIQQAHSNSADAWVEIEVDVKKLNPGLNFGYALYDDTGNLLYWSLTTDMHFEQWPEITTGRNMLRSKLPCRLLNEGQYQVRPIASIHFKEWIINPSEKSPVVNYIVEGGLSDSPFWLQKRPGLLAPVHSWFLKKCNDFNYS
jgi:lipopolysaccharide transport system ATP-binding protein